MSTTLSYLFDPLCGWCYGASPAIQQLGQQSSFTLELAPTGLFAGTGRTVDAQFAAFAWANDQRIAQLTGQAFGDDYRHKVLGHLGSRFDSAAMTLALTAVSLTEPARELATLAALQQARYVQGRDTGDAAAVGAVLRELGLTAAADLLRQSGAELLAANAARIRHAQGLMQRFGLQGVPALVVSDGKGARVLRGDALYGDTAHLLAQIAAA